MNCPRLCWDNQLDRRIAKGCTVARLTSLRFFFSAHSAFGGGFWFRVSGFGFRMFRLCDIGGLVRKEGW